MRKTLEQLEAEALELPMRERVALAHRLLEGLAETEHTKARYTPKQGQYLSFIHFYTKIHGLPPSEADMQRYLQGVAASGASDDPHSGGKGVDRAGPQDAPIRAADGAPLFLTRPGVRVRSRVRALSPGSER